MSSKSFHPAKSRRQRLLCLLLGASYLTLGGFTQAQNSEDNIILFEADYVTRESAESPIIAEGNVQAYFGERLLSADKLIYDEKTDIVTASGNVSITDSDGMTFFADDVELTGDLADGIATNFSALLADDSRLAGNTLVKTGDTKNVLSKAVYTACDVCKEDGEEKKPSWRVRAAKITQDKEKKVIRFNNATFDILGVPALYTPYLQMPDPSVKRQSGLLAPKFGSTSRQGVYLETPYYFAISDSQDFTFSPLFMEKQGILLKGEYRFLTPQTKGVFQAGYIDARKDELNVQTQNNLRVPENRFHFYGELEHKFREFWTAGFDVDHVSDKAYLKTYNVLPEGELRSPSGVFRPDRLDSNFFLRRRTENSLFNFEALAFQSLRREDDNAYAAQALPRIQYQSKLQKTPIIGGETNFELNFLSLVREEGIKSFRSIFASQWERVFTTKGGHRFKAYAELRGDVYNYQDLDQGNEVCNASTDSRLNNFDGFDNFVQAKRSELAQCVDVLTGSTGESSRTVSRVLPTIGAEWSYPLAKQTKNATIIIEPKVQLIASTNNDFNDEFIASDGSIKTSSDVLNEDSQFFEFDTTSLFYWNKSSGYDLWENGQRVNVGVSATAAFDNGLNIEGAIGQQFRSEETNIYRISNLDAGIGQTSSDIVGSFNLNYKNKIALNNNVRFDKDDGTLRRAESSFSGRFGKFGSNLTYIKIQPSDSIGASSEFLTGAVSYDINENWTFGGRFAEDLTANRNAQQTFSLGYRDECTKILLSYRRDNTNSDGFEFGDSLTINMELTGFNN